MLKNAGRNLICGIKPIKLGPMEEILVFKHDPFEDLGVFAEVLERQAAGYRVIRLFDGENSHRRLGTDQGVDCSRRPHERG
jgi:hypothetical protein